jgi:DNA topoisomerase II
VLFNLTLVQVAQLGAYVAEHTAYHHGEQSLYETVIKLAQDFVGANNINILSPEGQFGTRYNGGKDAASPRYIFTKIPSITRTIFHQADNAVLTYLDDEGISIEPEWYMPILPMLLVNGASGIGTGEHFFS